MEVVGVVFIAPNHFLSIRIFKFNMFFVLFNKEFLLAIQEFILLMNGSY
jgi:hypothetical protein